MAQAIIAIGASIGTAAASAGTAVSGMFAAGGAAAGGAAAGSAAATSAGVLGTGISASTISTVLSVGSALASIGSGFAQSAAAKDQARQLAVQTSQMKAGDSQKRASMAAEYADLVSEQTAIQIANGLNPNVGTPATVRGATREIAERNIATSRENTQNRTSVARMQQRSLMKSANTHVLGGVMQAANTGIDAYRAVG